MGPVRKCTALLALALLLGSARTVASVDGSEFDRRLGDDEGAALALLIGGNLRGHLGKCD